MNTAESIIAGGEEEIEMEQEDVASQDGAAQTQEQQQKKSKIKNPCVYCAKSAASGSIQCTVCAMWCHNNCTGLSKDTLKNLVAQAKEVGLAYWACLAFNQKWNSQIRDTMKRQDNTEKNVEENRRNINENRQSIEILRREADELRKELREKVTLSHGVEERVEAKMADELREREARKMNLVIHGVQEVIDEIKNPKERMERDLEECSKIVSAMGVRRKINFRFCRRLGEKGRDPRPIVVGLYSEDNRRELLGGARELRYSKYEQVSIVPDLTIMQRKSEQRLREEADRRNEELSEEDKERNVKWMVVGRRGEKRIIKGTERDNQYGQGDNNRRRTDRRSVERDRRRERSNSRQRRSSRDREWDHSRRRREGGDRERRRDRSGSYRGSDRRRRSSSRRDRSGSYRRSERRRRSSSGRERDRNSRNDRRRSKSRYGRRRSGSYTRNSSNNILPASQPAATGAIPRTGGVWENANQLNINLSDRDRPASSLGAQYEIVASPGRHIQQTGAGTSTGTGTSSGTGTGTGTGAWPSLADANGTGTGTGTRTGTSTGSGTGGTGTGTGGGTGTGTGTARTYYRNGSKRGRSRTRTRTRSKSWERPHRRNRH